MNKVSKERLLEFRVESIYSRNYRLYVRDGKLRKLSGRESLLLQGFGKNIFDKAKGYRDSLLLQQTGNAMSVNVIESIGSSLKELIIKNGDL